MKNLLPAVAALWMALTALPSSATTVERYSVEDLATRAETIVQGVVRGSRTYWSADRKLILTGTTIEITESLKGQAPRSVEVTTVGGQIGDTVLHVSGMPAFAAGETAIVFVERSNGYNTVTGLGQGKFSVVNGEVANSVSGLSFADGAPARTTRMPLQSFKNVVRAAVGRGR